MNLFSFISSGYGELLAAGGFLLSLILLIEIILLRKKIRRILRGKNAESLEDTIVELHKKIRRLESAKIHTDRYLGDVERRLKKSVQSIETVRYNPFKGTSGGNQSFATAFLNEEGNGVVISSLYSRDRVSVFSKPIKNSSSPYELSPEEKEAFLLAEENVK